MTEAYRVSCEYVKNNWKADFIDYTSNVEFLKPLGNESYVDSLNIFFLNPKKSVARYKHMMYQFKQSDVNLSKVERIEPTKYPCVADYTLKNNIISWDHIAMWQKAFDKNLDGALFFEDDVYFLKNWKVLLQDIFDKYGRDKTHIVRFDSAPLISVSDLPKDKIAIFHPQAFACVGGYYMSRDAITTALNIVKTRPWTWVTIETLVGDIIKDYFKTLSYETSPRICIQNWFLGDGSALQKDEHMKRLKDVQCNGYLQRYHDRYTFDNDSQKVIDNILEEYKTPTYNERVLE